MREPGGQLPEVSDFGEARADEPSCAKVRLL